VNEWHAFTAVCARIRTGLLGAPWHDGERPIRWELMIRQSSDQGITPTLAWTLRDDTSLPNEVRGYFAAMLSLNEARNESLLVGLARVVAILNASGIDPVLLKGAAHLVEDLYPACGLRVVGDLDLLIADGRAHEAAEALRESGFAPIETDLPDTHHHLPMLKDASGLGVELHTRVQHDATSPAAEVSWFVENKRPFSFRGLRLHLADPTRTVAHNVVHGQLNHALDRDGRISLRALIDLAMIRKMHESVIDWAELDDRFVRAGHGEALATYLHFGEKLLGQPMPSLRCRPRANAIADFRRTIDPLELDFSGEAQTITFTFSGADARPVSGHCWQIQMPPALFAGASSQAPACFGVELFEDGEPLGPADSPHHDIASRGRGSFSHWADTLYFSAANNADPHVPGHTYEVRMQVPGLLARERDALLRRLQTEFHEKMTAADAAQKRSHEIEIAALRHAHAAALAALEHSAEAQIAALKQAYDARIAALTSNHAERLAQAESLFWQLRKRLERRPRLHRAIRLIARPIIRRSAWIASHWKAL